MSIHADITKTNAEKCAYELPFMWGKTSQIVHTQAFND